MPDFDISRAAGARRRLQVAIIYPFFAHYRTAVLKELVDHGEHDYVFACDTHDPTGGIPLMDAAIGHFIHAPCSHFPGGLMWQQRLITLALRADLDCFIFLGNASWPATWIAAILARLRGRRVLFWTHGWTRPDSGLKRFVRTLFYRIPHGLLLYGHYAQRIGCALGLRPEALHVVYNSLDFEHQRRFRYGAAQTGEARNTKLRLFGAAQVPVVIASARLTASKRFDLLIRALGLLRTEGVTVNLLVIGDGPDRQRLETLAQDAGISAHFAGAVYEESQLANLFQCASVTVSPGNIGLTCMHSLGYGVPVITHDDPAEQGPEWEAIVPGRTGDLFRKNSVEDLARAIRDWTRVELPTQAVSADCLAVIESRYHPRIQRLLIEKAVHGMPADTATQSPHLPAQL